MMAQPVQNAPVHQLFNISAHSFDNVSSLNPAFACLLPPVFCNVEFQSDVFKLTFAGIIDNGSTVTMVPHTLLKKSELEKLEPTDVKITGVTPGESPIIGKAIADITLGGVCTFKDLDVFISKAKIPIIIGNNVLKHSTLQKYEMDNQNLKLTIHRKFSNGPKTFEVEILKDKDSWKFMPRSNVATEEADKTPQRVSSKEEWLKSKGVKLPGNQKSQQLEAVTNLLRKYEDILGSDEDQGTFYKSVRIPTNGQTKSISANHVPQALEKEVSEEIKRMIDLGILEDCADPKGFNSPVFAVRKPNGKVRVVANFKDTLNRCLQNQDPFPMPTMDHLFNKVGNGNKYFASLDLIKGYWQIPIDEEDRYKTAFTWEGRCLQYTVLVMGLTCAGQIFSRCVAEALGTLENKCNIVTYIDDNLVFAKTFDEFIKALEEVFKALQKFGLKLNPAKCNFLDTKADFLGRLITEDGYRPNPEYAQGVMDMNPPTSKQENLKLVGRLTWIRQFLEVKLLEKVRSSTFAELMKPIHNLNKADVVFEWTEEANKAFQKIKKKLTSNPIISFPDFNLPFTLTTDASDRACGAILMQETPCGKKKIVAVASRTFSPTEQNWSTTEREAFAIKWAILKFDYFLNSRTFVVFTDHKSLVYLDRRQFNNAKIRRWQEEMKAYKFVLQYIEGESNVWADMLSRSPGLKKHEVEEDSRPAGKFFKVQNSKMRVYAPSWVLEDLPKDKVVLSEDSSMTKGYYTDMIQSFTAIGNHKVETPKLHEVLRIADAQAEDTFLAKIIQNLVKADSGVEINWKSILDPDDHRTTTYLKLIGQFKLEPGSMLLTLRRPNGKCQMVIPSSLRPTFLHHAHDLLNHSGTTRTEQHLLDFWWEGKVEDIKGYIDSCETCAKRKGNYGRIPKWNIGHCRRGTRPFEIVYLDFVHMPPSKGKRYILTILDSFSRFFMAIPCARDRALDAARGLYQLFLRHRERPQIVSSDRGTHFTGEVYKNFCDLMGIKQELHCPWRPQSSGNIERQHRTMKNAIFMLCDERKCDWTDILESVISNMNATVNRSTGVSAQYIITGRHPNLGLPQKNDQIRHSNPASYGMKVTAMLRQVHEAVELANHEADLKMERKMNAVPTKVLRPGDKVLLYRPQSAKAKATHLPWLPGFSVVKSNRMVVKIKNDQNQTHWVHRTHLRYVPDRPNHLQVKTIAVPIPMDSNQAPKSSFRERLVVRNADSSTSRIPRPSQNRNQAVQNRENPIQNPSGPLTNQNRTLGRQYQIVQSSVQGQIPNSNRIQNQNTDTRRSVPQNTVNRNSSIQRSLRHSIAVAPRQTITRNPVPARPTRASLLRNQQLANQRSAPVQNPQIRRNPARERRLPSKLRSGDFSLR